MRRPEARAPRPATLSEPVVDREDEEEESLDLSVTAVTLEDYRVARPEPEPAAVSSSSRRIRERRARAHAGRTGPSQMDVVAQHYSHVKGDLVRIAVIATVMFGIIVALSFVIK